MSEYFLGVLIASLVIIFCEYFFGTAIAAAIGCIIGGAIATIWS